MSNDFLQGYSIPLIQNNYTNTEPLPPQPEQSYPVAYNSSRYLPPGRPEDFNYPIHARKRSYNYASVKQPSVTVQEDGKIPIFTGRDTSYPDELNLLINPLYCDLCKVQLNSAKTAACHYESKIHDRKITNWLNEHYPDNPPAVKRFVKTGPIGPQAFHCDVCDLPLTSMIHVKQHYAGRRHQLVVQKKSDPSGAGYYNDEGKWVRTGTKKYSTINDNGRFGIGTDFLQAESTATTPENQNQEIAVVVSPKRATPINESLCCKVCNITATSASQMEMHMTGTKHKKKLALSNMTLVSNDNSSATTLLSSNVEIPYELAMHRTPTGSFYCDICNTTMNNVTVYQQHLDGKKHKLKMKVNETTATNCKVTN